MAINGKILRFCFFALVLCLMSFRVQVFASEPTSVDTRIESLRDDIFSLQEERKNSEESSKPVASLKSISDPLAVNSYYSIITNGNFEGGSRAWNELWWYGGEWVDWGYIITSGSGGYGSYYAYISEDDWLFSDEMYVSSYADNIYIEFDRRFVEFATSCNYGVNSLGAVIYDKDTEESYILDLYGPEFTSYDYSYQTDSFLLSSYVSISQVRGHFITIDFMHIQEDPNCDYSFYLDNVQVDEIYYPENIYVTSSSGGSVDPQGTVQVTYGGSQTFNIYPDPGYSVKDVFIDGYFYSNRGTPVTFNNVWEPYFLHVDFYEPKLLGGSALKYDYGWPDATYLTGDFDNDGYIDDVAIGYPLAGENRNSWWVMNSNGSTLSGGVAWKFGYGWPDATYLTGDFDNDGFVDDIAIGYPLPGENRNTWWVMKSNGSSFSGGVAWKFGYGWPNATYLTGDFDEDGYKDDIAIGYPLPGQNRNTWWVMNSDGDSFVGGPSLLQNYGWLDATYLVGDLDHDSYFDDIVIGHPVNSYTNQNSWWVMNSNGSTFLGGVAWKFNYGWPGATYNVGDYDGDTFVDDISIGYPRSYVPNQNSWWVMSSNGNSFGGGTAWRFDYGWLDANYMVGDYDNDGNLDDLLLGYPAFSRRNTWWTLNSKY